MAIWYKSFVSLRGHYKRGRLAALLGVDPVTAMGHLHLFWGYICAYAEDGRIQKLRPEEIAWACEWKGDAAIFKSALKDTGFIEDTPEGEIVHKWWEKNGSHIDEYNRKQRKKLDDTRQVADSPQPVTEKKADRLPQIDREIHTDVDTDIQYLTAGDRLKYAKMAFTLARSKHADFKGKGYHWTDADRKAANSVLYQDGTHVSKTDLDTAISNFFASDLNFTSGYIASCLFNKINQFIGGPVLDFAKRGGPGKTNAGGRNGSRTGIAGDPRPALKGVGSAVRGLWTSDPRDNDPLKPRAVTTENSEGGHEKV